MLTIETEDNGTLTATTEDNFTGEGMGVMRIEINNESGNSWIYLNEKEAEKLRDDINSWLSDYYITE